jgi:hypothetical protein
LVVLFAGSTLLLVQSKALDEAPYKLSRAVAKLASINLLKFGFLLLVRLNLGFTMEVNFLLCSSYLLLGVPNWVPNMHYHPPMTSESDRMLLALSYGPAPNLMTYQAYDINGYTFYTEERDKGGNYQNLSVTMVSYMGEERKRYYGKIKEI